MPAPIGVAIAWLAFFALAIEQVPATRYGDALQLAIGRVSADGPHLTARFGSISSFCNVRYQHARKLDHRQELCSFGR